MVCPLTEIIWSPGRKTRLRGWAADRDCGDQHAFTGRIHGDTKTLTAARLHHSLTGKLPLTKGLALPLRIASNITLHVAIQDNGLPVAKHAYLAGLFWRY